MSGPQTEGPSGPQVASPWLIETTLILEHGPATLWRTRRPPPEKLQKVKAFLAHRQLGQGVGWGGT